jgi:hypothetical protein
MYTFAPLADIPVDHGGFIFICCILLIALAVAMLNGNGGILGTLFVCVLIANISYGVSFHWSDQSTKKFANTQVQGEFAGYQPEVRLEKSGKSSYHDNHYMYVVYTVNGNAVIMQGSTGIEYPKHAILYKN